MVATKEQSIDLLRWKNTGQRRHLVVKVTNTCYIKCEHCYEEAVMSKADGGIDVGLVKAALRTMKPGWCVWLQGGEPMLYPDKCVELANLARANGHKVALFTSAFWARDQRMMRLVFDKIRPNVLNVSINEWLMTKVPLENVNVVAREAKKSRDVMMYTASTYGTMDGFEPTGEKLVDLDKLQPEIAKQLTEPVYRIPSALIPYGSGTNLADRVVYFETDQLLVCTMGGFSLGTNGDLVANCTTCGHGCRFGKVEAANLECLAERMHTPKLKVVGKTYGFSDACRYAKCSILDPKWADDKYYEVVDFIKLRRF